MEELEPIFNYCHSNALLAHLWPLDPAHLDRFTWHGPLPAMLFHWFMPNCSLQQIYVARTLAYLIIPCTLLVLVWRNMLPPMIGLATSLFAFALFEKLQFRPESFALIFVVLAYCAYRFRWPILEGFLGACLIATAPVGGALYALARLLLGGWPTVREVLFIVVGAAIGFTVLALLYPFPIKDLFAGLAANADVTVTRTDGNWATGLFLYYVRSDFLPLFGVTVVLLFFALLRAAPLVLLLVPLVWFFGLKAPPTNYNLMPLAIGLMLLGYPQMSRTWRSISIAAFFIPALLGLSQLTLRDTLSAQAYPDSYNQTRALVNKLLSEDKPLIRTPPFTIFMSPALVKIAHNTFPDLSNEQLRGARIVVADNSSRRQCPTGSKPINQDMSKIFIFNSSSSWAVGLCEVD
ncbi:MAG TPA: hypothetical protein VL492_03720 [Methylovirgula sp.]|nr:hypothetical protein [Methylovirgula sp.]